MCGQEMTNTLADHHELQRCAAEYSMITQYTWRPVDRTWQDARGLYCTVLYCMRENCEYSTVQYSTVLYSQFSLIQYSTVQYEREL